MAKPARKVTRKLVRRFRTKLDGHLPLMAVTAGAGLLAERLVYNALASGWRALRGDDPPSEPESADVDWREAIAWVAVSGLAMALVGLAARRGAAAGWARAQQRFA
jgi:hypothetical protein